MKRDGKSCYFQLIGNQGFDQFFGGPHMLSNGVLMLPNTKIDQNLHPKRQTHWCAKQVLRRLRKRTGDLTGLRRRLSADCYNCRAGLKTFCM